jgi:hypothetical protein
MMASKPKVAYVEGKLKVCIYDGGRVPFIVSSVPTELPKVVNDSKLDYWSGNVMSPFTPVNLYGSKDPTNSLYNRFKFVTEYVNPITGVMSSLYYDRVDASLIALANIHALALEDPIFDFFVENVENNNGIIINGYYIGGSKSIETVYAGDQVLMLGDDVILKELPVMKSNIIPSVKLVNLLGANPAYTNRILAYHELSVQNGPIVDNVGIQMNMANPAPYVSLGKASDVFEPDMFSNGKLIKMFGASIIYNTNHLLFNRLDVGGIKINEDTVIGFILPE